VKRLIQTRDKFLALFHRIAGTTTPNTQVFAETRCLPDRVKANSFLPAQSLTGSIRIELYFRRIRDQRLRWEKTSLQERDDVMRAKRATAAGPSGDGAASCAAGSDEHRSGLRERTLKAGSILSDRAAAIDCLVRNISESGVCLEVESPPDVPENFTLVVGHDPKRPCQVAWRSERWLGAYFVSAVSP